MSDDLYVTVKRNGSTLYSNVYAQLDHMSVTEAAYYGGAAPYHRYEAYLLATIDVQQQDLLIDPNTIDPKTNAPTQYRVINHPEAFPDNHMELVVDRVIGR